MDTLKDATKALKTAMEDITSEGERLKKTTDIPGILAFYKNVYEYHALLDQLVGLLADVKEEYSKRVIPPLFQAAQVDSVRALGKNFILNPEFHASMPAEKLPKGIEWLKANGYEPLIKEGVNGKTLTAAMRDWIKDKGELPPEDVMTIYMGHYISMRKK